MMPTFAGKFALWVPRRRLPEEGLSHWHSMLMAGNQYIETVGAYRTHEDAMQIVPGRLDKPTIHFEAPPSRRVASEMETFITWFSIRARWPMLASSFDARLSIQ
ncbi:hypothetical protein [Rhizobium sp. AN5]|uniref:hypothetical protein n=1 Tax=Rhizobium sp. AN5 TaxID=1855304 RepID=UPI0039DFB23D